MKRLFVICAVLFVSMVPRLSGEEKTGKTDLGLSYVATSGNTSTETFSGKLSMERECVSVRCLFRGSMLQTRDNDEEKANKLELGTRGEKVVTAGLFVFLEFTYTRDRFSGYTYRASVGPGLGYDIISNEKHQFKSLVSSMLYKDKYAVGDTDEETYGTVKTALNYMWQIQPNMKLESNSHYLVSVKDTEKSFFLWDAAVNVAINSRFSIGVSYQVNVQNQVPAPEIKKTDTSFMTSLLVHL
ncbi:DUF481 domain-containing protein [bacterium]|nr:DUF481 domain-containing protein [bacterium]